MRRILLINLLMLAGHALWAQSSYFPPIDESGTWETVNPESLGWCTQQIESFYTFLDQTKAESIVVLKDGKIVLERYFEGRDADDLKGWKNATASLVSVLLGIALEGNTRAIDIDDPASEYLGTPWSSLTFSQEAQVNVFHHLSMSTGIDDDVANQDCINRSCLNFIAPAGDRWAYHNASWRLITRVITEEFGGTIQSFSQNMLNDRIGMGGVWADFEFFSTARDMARFGLLALNRGEWNGQELIDDEHYIDSMFTSSQTINPAFGYLWWLNGKDTFMLPQSQERFEGKLIENAPSDLIAALGEDDQKIYIVPSEGLVVVRQGDAAGISKPALSDFDNAFWEKLSVIINGGECVTVGIDDEANRPVKPLKIIYDWPNQSLTVDMKAPFSTLSVRNSTGKLMKTHETPKGATSTTIDINTLPSGMYILEGRSGRQMHYVKFIKQ